MAGRQARCAGHVVSSLTSAARSARPPCLPRSDDPGFSIDEAEVTYWGPCPDLFHRPQFLSTMIRLVRKDSHV